jgi:hypothetical protein
MKIIKTNLNLRSQGATSYRIHCLWVGNPQRAQDHGCAKIFLGFDTSLLIRVSSLFNCNKKIA